MRMYRGLRVDGKGWIHGALYQVSNVAYICLVAPTEKYGCGYSQMDGRSLKVNRAFRVHPNTVGQSTGKKDKDSVEIFAGMTCVMECWNGEDDISGPSHTDTFEGIVVYDQRICRFGLQTELCDKGQIEVGLEDSQYTTIEIVHDEQETDNG